MSLARLLGARAAAGRPVRVGLIGAGKFGSMYLAQARRTPGVHLVGVADVAIERAREALSRTSWPPDQVAARSFEAALARGGTYLTDDAEQLIASDAVDLVIEATGSPAAGIRHALLCCRHGRDVIMVNVEADALAGPLLARRAAEAGIVYSLAYGDQPSLICELVDWARTIGVEVICAGKGTKYLPEYHASTPDTVWRHYGFTEEQLATGDFNAKMFNSFLDGTKSAIEMAAVANATGLLPDREGLRFPPASVYDLPQVCRPRSVGGALEQAGTLEVVSSLHRDGRPVEHGLRWGVYVTFVAGSAYVADCFSQYGLITDATGQYAALYRPSHLIGLELGISVASVALRREATGAPESFVGDVVAVAKRDLDPGEQLDGEGGFTVFGRLALALDSLAAGCLPIGLAQRCAVANPVCAGDIVKWEDVRMDETSEAVQVRREMEALFRAAPEMA
ncbi:MAG TPA: Gfo/Idh/MocA family oxidoreductase [Chloroflexota bacterium]|nr:Gfo/Idh/MocA family oxidoreductase [Chloroflexota bacterium]